MARKFYNLPSLTALAAFETTARHRSMARAARELNVTSGAISRQVRALEGFVGCELLRREQRGVGLTQRGAELFTVLSSSFSHISRTLDFLQTCPTSSDVTLGASTAVASLWLMKRVGDFWRAHPDVTVNHLISDVAADLRSSKVDLRIRYGNGLWPGETSVLLFQDFIIPVCGPAFLEEHADTSIEALMRASLLKLEPTEANWTTWEEWFRMLGYHIAVLRGSSINNYTSIIHAALDNQGVALGWSGLINQYLQEGSLVRFGDAGVPSPEAFYITWSESLSLSEPATLLRDWLLKVGKEVSRLRLR